MTQLLTVRAAADRLGVGYSTLKQWIYDGSIRQQLNSMKSRLSSD